MRLAWNNRTVFSDTKQDPSSPTLTETTAVARKTTAVRDRHRRPQRRAQTPIEHQSSWTRNKSTAVAQQTTAATVFSDTKQDHCGSTINYSRHCGSPTNYSRHSRLDTKQDPSSRTLTDTTAVARQTTAASYVFPSTAVARQTTAASVGAPTLMGHACNMEQAKRDRHQTRSLR